VVAATAAAERAISEADILQLCGDRLYALSRFRGLSIVDVSNPSALSFQEKSGVAARSRSPPTPPTAPSASAAWRSST
jgi:hypothetical protein